MRSVSLDFLQAMFAQETGRAPILLITIDHSSLDDPIRVAGWDVDIESRGNTFIAFPFNIQLPSDVDESMPRAVITIDNVDRTIVRAIRNASGLAPTVTIEIVMDSDHDAVEANFPEFVLRDVTYDALTVEGELTLDILMGEPFPAGRFRPGAFPSLF